MIIITIDHGNFSVRRDTDIPEHVFKIQPNGTLIGYKGKPIKNYPKGFSKNMILNSLNNIKEEHLPKQQKTLLFNILNEELNKNQCQMLERMINAGCQDFRVSKNEHISDEDIKNFRTWLNLARKYEEEHPNSTYNIFTLKRYQEELIFRDNAKVQILLNYYDEYNVKTLFNRFYDKGYWDEVFKWACDDSIFNYLNVVCRFDGICTIVRLFEELISLSDCLNVKREKKNPLKQLYKLRKEAENKENQIINDTLKKNQNKKWQFEDDNFEVIVPTTYDELIQEGRQQHNCVGDFWIRNYGNNLKMGVQSRGVVFIRKKNNPTRSYITCDFSLNTLEIKQYLGNCNISNLGKEADDFRTKFQNHLKSLL